MIATLHRRSSLEVFPESSGPDTICFRRYSCAFGESVIVEAGLGQASLVFEEEQGQHEIVSLTKARDSGYYALNSDRSASDGGRVISQRLNALLECYGGALERSTSTLCRRVGIPWVAMEGYFSARDGTLVVVDLDLPFDEVFFYRADIS